MRHTTKRQDAQFLAKAFEDATKEWKVGDACWSFKGPENTTVERIKGNIVYLADGTHGHYSRMRRPR